MPDQNLSPAARKVIETLIPRIGFQTGDDPEMQYEALGYHGPEDLVNRKPRITYDAVLRWLSRANQQQPAPKL